MYENLIFVDCEAAGNCPALGTLTEFGAVQFGTKLTFHGKMYNSHPDPSNPAVPIVDDFICSPSTVFQNFDKWLGSLIYTGRLTFVSDNPAYDWQWINDGFWQYVGSNPFGHSARRIGDFYAGLCGNFKASQTWKKLRITRHDHNPVNDAMGNVEAFERILFGER